MHMPPNTRGIIKGKGRLGQLVHKKSASLGRLRREKNIQNRFPTFGFSTRSIWHIFFSERPVSVFGFIPGFSVFVKSPVSVPVSAPEMHQKHRKSLPNGRQQGGAFGAAPRGGASCRPLGFCCLPFGKDFLSFRCTSGTETSTETGDFTKTLKPGMKPESETCLSKNFLCHMW